MDYLPYPPDATLPPIVVPYLPGYQFDDGDDDTIYIRLLERSSKAPTRQYAGELQEWLFFGLIDKLADEPPSRSNFVRRGVVNGEPCDVIDASPVRDLIDRLTVKLQSDDCPAAIAEELPLRLAYAKEICDGFKDVKDADDSLLAIYLSVCVLVEFLSCYLFWAINSGLGTPKLHEKSHLIRNAQTTGNSNRPSDIDSVGVDQLPALSRLLHKRMVRNGWCEHQILNLDCHDSRMVMYYLSSLLRTEPKAISHANCTSSMCSAYNTSEAEYVTRHVNESCACDLLGVDEEKVVKILATGKIPLVSMREDGTGGLEIDVVPLKAELRYTAISHVWADGLGNTTGNALPGCQLHRLHMSLTMLQQSPFKNLISFGRRRPGVVVFWMDTLCIPVKPQHKDLRLKAIDQMAIVYSGAEATLVLDEEFQGPGSETEPLESLWARCLTSKWNSRCWTLQEGMLAKRCLVQFRGLSLAISPEPRFQYLLPAWAIYRLGKRYPFVLLKVFWRLGVKAFEIDTWRFLWAAGGSFPRSILICQLQEACYKQAQTNAEWMEMRDSPYGVYGISVDIFARSWHFVSMWNTVARRSSTKMDDIHVILANLTDFKASQIQAIPRLQDRTKVMLQSMDCFPVEMMFGRAIRPLAGKNHPDRWVPAAPGPELLEGSENITAQAIGDSGSLIMISQDKTHEFISGIICLIESKGMIAQEMVVTLPFKSDGYGFRKLRLECHTPPEDELVRDASQKCILLLRYYPGRGRSRIRGARFLVTGFVDNHQGKNVQLVVSRFDCPVFGDRCYSSDESYETRGLSVLRGARLEERQRLAVECCKLLLYRYFLLPTCRALADNGNAYEAPTPNLREEYALRSRYMGLADPTPLRNILIQQCILAFSSITWTTICLAFPRVLPRWAFKFQWLLTPGWAVFVSYMSVRNTERMNERFSILWKKTYEDDWKSSSRG